MPAGLDDKGEDELISSWKLESNIRFLFLTHFKVIFLLDFSAINHLLILIKLTVKNNCYEH